MKIFGGVWLDNSLESVITESKEDRSCRLAETIGGELDF